jgi:hypothetical protein
MIFMLKCTETLNHAARKNKKRLAIIIKNCVLIYVLIFKLRAVKKYARFDDDEENSAFLHRAQ